MPREGAQVILESAKSGFDAIYKGVSSTHQNKNGKNGVNVPSFEVFVFTDPFPVDIITKLIL